MHQSLEEIVRDKVAASFDGADLKHFDNIYKLVVQPAEKAVVSYVLKRYGGNQVHTAKALGINRNTLRKKIKIYGLGGDGAQTTP